MEIPALVYVLVTQHLIGDWWLQSNDMALGKSKNTRAGIWALTRHVGVVSAVLMVALDWYYVFALGEIMLSREVSRSIATYVAVNFAAHWVTDYVTSRLNAKAWFVSCVVERNEVAQTFICAMRIDDRKRFWFWRGIGTDQWIHYVTLFATAEWLL